MASQRRVTGSRLGRLSMLGQLAGGIASGMLGEGARQLARGRRPAVADLLLTPANAQRVAERLSEMRGAAMKVGQLVSMDGGHLLPAELSSVLDRLREDAHQMPLGQVASSLKSAWGDNWQVRFDRFMFQPIAAASIGQVHQARLKDGRRVAVKIQYPGIRQSIDSDVDNVASILRMFRLLPDGIDIAPLLDEAKRQLHREADYRHEAAAMARFAAALEGDLRFEVPQVIDDLSSADVLTMTFMGGHPIEDLAEAAAPLRNSVAQALFELALDEVFARGLVQTDPNFANYLFAPVDGRIQLLDFGATREYPDKRRRGLACLLQACLDDDDTAIAAAAEAVGYLGEGDPEGYRSSVVELLRIATEPARQRDYYAFDDTSLARRMSDKVFELRVTQRYGRLPPTDVLFLHRKLGGLYLLLARLRATLPVRELLLRRIDRQHGDGATPPCRAMA